MNVRRINFLLWTLAGVLSAGALLSVGVGVLTPVEVTYDEPAGPRKTPATSQVSPDAQLALEGFAPVWALKLRRPLSDLAAGANTNTEVENPASAVDGSGAPFVLVGTIGDSLAMVRTAAGAVEIKGVGELANGAKIVAIRPWQVDVEIGGARRTIAKSREPGGG